jgi:hypothetical protein
MKGASRQLFGWLFMLASFRCTAKLLAELGVEREN